MVVLDVLTGRRKDMDRFEIPAIAQVCPEPYFDLLVHRVPVAPYSSARPSASVATVGWVEYQ